MAFKGDLKNISLFDVLQTLHQNRQAGVLVVQRGAITKKIYIDPQGVRIFFTRSFRPLRLGEIFVRRGRITPQDVEILLLQQKQSYRPMGRLLVDSGKVDAEEVERILRYHAEDEIYEIFSWEDGTFGFYDGQSIDEHSATPLSDVIMDPAGLCLEAARRLDEMEQLREIIPSERSYFTQVEEMEPDREANSQGVCDVFDALQRPNSINELRDLVGMSLFEVLGTAARLVEGGLIRPLESEELLAAGRAAREASEYERSADIFEEAHGLEPTLREILDECVEAVQRLEQPKRLSRLLRTLGNLCLVQGSEDEGVELLEQALRSDPDNQETLQALLGAFTQLGDAERTAEISLKMARSLADDGNLEAAIESCRGGLEMAPESIALRHQLSQLLLRCDRSEEAGEELWTLIRGMEGSSRVMRSKKAHDLLVNCYRLLLRINPHDEEVLEGMRNLDRVRVSTLRRRNVMMHSGIAAAILAVVSVVGLTLRGENPGDLLAEAAVAYRRGNLAEVQRVAYELVDKFPDAEETRQALSFRNQLDQRQKTRESARKKTEGAIRSEYEDAWNEVKGALNEQPELEALDLVEPYLDSLNDQKAAFLRSAMKAHFEYEMGVFLDRVVARFNKDRKQVAGSEIELRRAATSIRSLHALEVRLGAVRGRNWGSLVPLMLERLDRIAKHPRAGKCDTAIARFRKRIAMAPGSFTSLDNLFYTVRVKRLRLEIDEAVDLARDKHVKLLRLCKFKEARDLYDLAYRKAEAVTDQQPRKYFTDLIRWLEQTNTREDMKEMRDEIDNIVATLKEVERLREAGQAAAAYRLFRPLAASQPVIQFEHEYKIPFSVRSTPSDAEVLVNGELVGRTPLAIDLEIVEISIILVRRPGFAEVETKIRPIEPKYDGELAVQLRKESAWERTISDEVEANPVLTRYKGRLLLLVATSRANLLAIDVATGEIAWDAPTNILGRVRAAPVVVGDRAMFIVGDLLHVVRMEDGVLEKKRTLRLPGQVTHDLAVKDGILYAATSERRLVAIRDQKILFDKPLAMAPSTRLVFVDGRLCMGTTEGRILVHDASTGAELDRLKARGDTSFLGGITAHGPLIVAGAEDGSLYAFDYRSGETAWSFPTAGPVSAPPVSDGKRIFLPTRDGWVYALDVTGKVLAKFDTQMASEVAPAIENDFLYVASGLRLAAHDAKANKGWWEFDFESQDGGPTHIVAGSGYVIAISERSRVVAFTRDLR